MIRYTLSAIIISSLLFLAGCGNLVNDELAGEEQDQNDVIPGNSFGTVIGNNFSTSGKTRIQSSSVGSYFISSTVIGDGGRDELWLSSIDKNANIRWSAALKNINSNDRLSRIQVIDKDNIYILADRFYPDAKADLIVIKVNSSGIVWQKCIGDQQKNLVYGTALTDDGGLIATGITVIPATDDNPLEYSPYAIRINPDGDIVWKKEYKIYLNPAEKKYFEIVTPAEIINMGDDEYLISGTAVNPDNTKLVVFYCRIDGREDEDPDDLTIYGGGMLLKATYVKITDETVSLFGNISYNDCIISVIGVTDTENSTSPTKYSILSLNNETLKVTSKKNYEFESFRAPAGIIRNGYNYFMLAGMIKPVYGKGIYTITFDKGGIVKELQTKSYSNIDSGLFNIEFNKMYENSQLLYAIKLYTPGVDEKDLFIDRYISPSVITSTSLKSIINKVIVDVEIDDPDFSDEDSAADIEELIIGEITDPGLVFSRY